MSEVRPRRTLGTGHWDKKLMRNMVDLSEADNYEDAKHEWIATGKVWWTGLGDEIPNYVKPHRNYCL